MTIIIFIIVLAVLIFVHELGHFLLARANGIRVDEFKIGFGPKLVSWTKGETQYGINLIPFGGFVKIHGEDPNEENIHGPDKDRSFANKNRWRQASVLFAGVFFNFLFACILYILIFSAGVTATKDGFEKYSSRFTNERIMVTSVAPGSPAESAGIIVGDVIAGSDTVEDIQKLISSSGGEPVLVKLLRNGEPMLLQIRPAEGIVEGKFAIGIGMDKVGDLRLPVATAVYEGFRYTGVMLRETTVGLYHFFSGIFKGSANFSDVAGPIGIAGIVGSAADLGFVYLLMITALISINLGVINLIPFPALDGGRILFVLIEGITRRRIPPQFANTVNAVGFFLLILLMVVVTYKDIAKLIN